MLKWAILPAALLAACGSQTGAVAQDQRTAGATELPFRVTPMADFDSPWAMTFLPGGEMLVTEKAGTLYLVSADARRRDAIATLPVDSAGQGGLMDVVLAPDFAKSHHVYLSYSAAGDGGKGVVLARGTLTSDRGARPALAGITELFRATPFVSGNGHYSGGSPSRPTANICSSPMASGRSSIRRRIPRRRWARCCG